MIIPVRCMNCGNMLADKWRYYQKEVSRLRNEQNITQPFVIDGTQSPDAIPLTPEKQVMNKLGITRYCCRKHLLTHRDLIDKI
jgi:DNA-directed RNA polymerase subunit N (RpoN/RPB10)